MPRYSPWTEIHLGLFLFLRYPERSHLQQRKPLRMTEKTFHEKVKDSQWWYSDSALRKEVQGQRFITLSIGGLECPMIHSNVGKDGRPTYSFKFLRESDKAIWRSANGSTLPISVVEVMNEIPDLQIDPDSIFDSSETAAPTVEAIDSQSNPLMNVAERTRLERKTDSKTLFDAYIFVDWSANNSPKRGKDSIWIGEAWYQNDELAHPVIQGGPFGVFVMRTTIGT